ncbi:dof zinc finger protein DOF5.1 [Abeliophyllum distichum]|uniref:Dof zinc finger protein DOF5.1 n=1 Tax=Abeliophyllum distichum TaxID=126358 RepID=A0ABD1TGS9_9LAMI
MIGENGGDSPSWFREEEGRGFLPSPVAGVDDRGVEKSPPFFLTFWGGGWGGCLDMSLNYSGISAPANEMNFQMGSNFLGGGSGGGSGVASLLSSGGIEQWRFHQQYPFLGSLDPSPPGLYHFEGGDEQSRFAGETSQAARPKLSSSMLNQNMTSSMKMEENMSKLNLSRQLMGMPGNDQWSTGAASWTDLSCFSSSSTNNPL